MQLCCLLLLGSALGVHSHLAGTYPWPIAPQDEPHAVASPYQAVMWAGQARAFVHGGIDVRAPAGTAVLAVAPGTVWIEEDGAFEDVTLTEMSGYSWVYGRLRHGSVPTDVRAAFHTGSRVECGAKLGEIAAWGAGYDHLHIERCGPDGGTLDPLEALLPIRDTIPPRIRGVSVLPHGTPIPYPSGGDAVVEIAGRVDIAVDAIDAVDGEKHLRFPPIAFRVSWQGPTPIPPRIFQPFRWRLPLPSHLPAPRRARGAALTPYLQDGPLAAANHAPLPGPQRFTQVITRLDPAGRPDLDGCWDTTAVADGDYELTVTAFDLQANQATATLHVRVKNDAPPPLPPHPPHSPGLDAIRRERHTPLGWATVIRGEPARHLFRIPTPDTSARAIRSVTAPPGARVLRHAREATPGAPAEVLVEVNTTAPQLPPHRAVHFTLEWQDGTKEPLVLLVDARPFFDTEPARLTFTRTPPQRDWQTHLRVRAISRYEVDDVVLTSHGGTDRSVSARALPPAGASPSQVLSLTLPASTPPAARAELNFHLHTPDGRRYEVRVPATMHAAP